MQYGEIPGLETPVSRIVQGAIMISADKIEESYRLLDEIFAVGCNTIDTAHVYGDGDVERIVGRWMEDRGIRDKIIIIGKGAHHSQDRRRVTPYDITSDLYDSLARLRVDVIDLCLLHRDDVEAPVGPIVEVLNEHQAAGRITAFGGSNWTHPRLEEANEYAYAHNLTPMVASSPNYTLADQVKEPWEGCITIAGPDGKEARDWYSSNQMGLFTWSTLARGFFSGRVSKEHSEAEGPDTMTTSFASDDNFSRLERVGELAREKGVTVPQIALAFVMSQPMNVFALIGSNGADELKDNIKGLEIELTRQELDWLDLYSDER